MSQITITLNGQTQIIQLGTLSPAVNQQITQAVASASASATSAATSATEAQAAANEAAAYVAELPTLTVQQSPTFAGLPPAPVGLYFVAADETKAGNPTFYYFAGAHRYWIAMVKDA
ncbi:hypothetical protein KDW10_22560 [Burkholderia vietnamiensis]|uniref:hypothetical protein n=1 Tax=Burkholderia vietnamiensis TaxID=60552 RepID=UPI001BA25A7A|nr:hypothetical protein [Burkholderia vietnamiensis]MBR8360120.1 hypothetical protein [Burkholderia vietnamiensis]